MNGTLAIGIDIGGTTIAGGLVDVSTGEVVRTVAVPTQPFSDPEALFVRVREMVTGLGRETGWQDQPLGIGVPELVSRDGEIRSAHLADWAGFAGVFDGPVAIEADVRCAAAAEARFGAIAGRESALYVSIGTGISATFVLRGDVWPGHRGNALVLASSEVQGVIPEDVASGPGLARLYAEAGGASDARAEDVLAADDTFAAAAISRAADVLSVNLGLAIDLLDPEVVVLGGGLGSAPGRYREAVVAATRDRIWSAETREVPFITAALGPAAGMIGAALATAKVVNV